jgi:hypothetical protein
MGGLSAATGAGVWVQIQDRSVDQSGVSRVKVLIEESAILGTQLPFRRGLARVARELKRLLDQVLQLLAGADLNRLGLTGDDDDDVDAVIRS